MNQPYESQYPIGIVVEAEIPKVEEETNKTTAQAAPSQAQIDPTRDLRAVRKRLGLSQAEFALRFGFPVASLRNWEQGRTKPDGAARVLLVVIAKRPDAVVEALNG